MICTGPLCTRQAVARGLCDAHRQQRRHHPERPLEPLRIGPRMTDEQASNLRTAYRNGITIAELARVYGLPARSIRATLVGDLNPDADVPPVDLRAGGHVTRAEAQARIEDARWLLDAGEWPVSVAERVGYPSLYAMVAAFERAGVPVPASAYREINIQRGRAAA